MNWKCLFFHDWVDLETTTFGCSDVSYSKMVCVRCKKVVDEIQEYENELNRQANIKLDKYKIALKIFNEHNQK